MCDITLALAAASTVIGGIGQFQQGQAAASAAEYNAKIGEMNATLSERKAKDALERGQREEQRKRMEVARLKGRQKATFAASGVDVAFGSPLDTLVDTAVLGELDALTIRSNAAREAYDFEVDAVNQRAGSALQRSRAGAARTGSFLQAGGTVLGGASDAYGDYRERVG